VTINFTQFISPYFAAWSDVTDDPSLSKTSTKFNYELRYGVEKRRMEEIALNSGASYQLQLQGLAQADWIVLMVQCIGQGYVQTAGKDASSTAITGYLPVYGVQFWPGIAILSTYNLTAAPTLYSQANGTIFEVFELTCQQDGS
jgi:hypothetical protein